MATFRDEAELNIENSAINLLKKLERAVDFPEIRLGLWLVWFFVGLPCFLLSYTGVLFGAVGLVSYRPNHGGDFPWFLIVSLLMGLGGVFGLVGAAIRLANKADSLARSRLQLRLATIGLTAGLLANAYPAIASIGEATFPWNLLFLVTLFLGVILLLSTISIREQSNDS